MQMALFAKFLEHLLRKLPYLLLVLLVACLPGVLNSKKTNRLRFGTSSKSNDISLSVEQRDCTIIEVEFVEFLLLTLDGLRYEEHCSVLVGIR